MVHGPSSIVHRPATVEIDARGECGAPNRVGLSWGRGRGRKLADEARTGGYWRAESVAPPPKRAFGFSIRSIRPFRVIGVPPVAAGPASFQCRASRSRGERRGTAERRGGALLELLMHEPLSVVLRSSPRFSAAPPLSLQSCRCSRPRHVMRWSVAPRRSQWSWRACRLG